MNPNLISQYLDVSNYYEKNIYESLKKDKKTTFNKLKKVYLSLWEPENKFIFYLLELQEKNKIKEKSLFLINANISEKVFNNLISDIEKYILENKLVEENTKIKKTRNSFIKSVIEILSKYSWASKEEVEDLIYEFEVDQYMKLLEKDVPISVNAKTRWKLIILNLRKKYWADLMATLDDIRDTNNDINAEVD